LAIIDGHEITDTGAGRLKTRASTNSPTPGTPTITSPPVAITALWLILFAAHALFHSFQTGHLKSPAHRHAPPRPRMGRRPPPRAFLSPPCLLHPRLLMLAQPQRPPFQSRRFFQCGGQKIPLSDPARIC
jgi:hypothetical protein